MKDSRLETTEQVQCIPIDLKGKQILVFSGDPPPPQRWLSEITPLLRDWLVSPDRPICVLILPGGTKVELLKVDSTEIMVGTSIEEHPGQLLPDKSGSL